MFATQFVAAEIAADRRRRAESRRDRRQATGRRRRRRALLAAVAATVLATPAAAQGATVTGQFMCQERTTIRPVAGARVELLHDDIFQGRVSTGTTDHAGRFALPDNGEGGDLKVRLVLRDRNGVNVRELASPWTWFADTPGSRALNRGSFVLRRSDGRTPHCAIWQAVRDAAERYLATTRLPLPYPDLAILPDGPNGGTPLAMHTAIHWPTHWPTDGGTAEHEFAHTVRHGLDGDIAHFGVDAAVFAYPQNHRLCERKVHIDGRPNLGFAFNEGWADYWAGSIPADDGRCPGFARDDWAVEGNVAGALRELELRCAGGDRGLMVAVLHHATGRVHSYPEFAAKLGCPRPRPEPAPPAEPRHSEPTPSPRAIGLAGVRRVVRRANRAQLTAVRELRGLGRCVRRNCLEELVDLVADRARAEIMELTATTLLRSSSAAEQVRLRDGDGLVARAVARRRQDERAGRALAMQLVGDMRRLAARVGGSDGAALRREIARFVAGGMDGGPPPAFAVPSSTFERPVRTKARDFVAPDFAGPVFRYVPRSQPPQPQPDPGPAQLTLSCPEKASTGAKLTVSGTLTPPESGTPVSLTYELNQKPSERTVTTDADGAFADGEYSPETAGTVRITARFAGDGKRTAAERSCEVSVS